MRQRRSALWASIGVALLAAPPLFAQSAAGSAAVRKPVAASTLTRDQIRALGDDEPVEVQGRITTKAQMRAELARFKPQADAWAQQAAAESEGRLQQVRAELESVRKRKIGEEKARASATLAGLLAAKVQAEQICGPYLEQVFSTTIGPGVPVTAVGTCFGSQKGTIRIEGQFPGGALLPDVTAWGDKAAGAVLPEGLTGIADHKVYISLTTPEGKTSNKVAVDFYATRDAKFLKAADTTPVCSLAADINDCDPVPGRTFDGIHGNIIGGSQGTDRVKATLKNGWTLKERVLSHSSWGLGTGTASFGNNPVGQSNFDQRIDFSAPGATRLHLISRLIIEGPVGLPHE